MSRKKRLVTLAMFLLFMFCFMLAGCGASKDKEKTADAEKESRIPVTVESVHKGTLERKIPLGGLLQAQEEVFLAARNPVLRIESVPVEVGDYVAAGTPLVIFDARELDLQLEQAQLAYERNQELYEAGAVSQFQLEQAETALANLQLQKENSILTTAISGFVASVTAVEGQLAGAAPLVSVVNTEQLELTVQVGESYVTRLKKGQEMAVKVAAVSEKPFRAVIKTIAPQADARTKAFPITLVMKNSQNKVKDGMYGEVELVIDRREDILVIPQYAVLDDEQKKIVYVVESEQAQKKEIELGLTLGDQAEVVRGLSAGEMLVIEGQYGIKEGTAVTSVVRGEGK